MGGQIALVLLIFGGRYRAESFLSHPPQFLSAAAYLWHLLIMPADWAFGHGRCQEPVQGYG